MEYAYGYLEAERLRLARQLRELGPSVQLTKIWVKEKLDSIVAAQDALDEIMKAGR